MLSPDYYDPKGLSNSQRKEFEECQQARLEEGYEFFVLRFSERVADLLSFGYEIVEGRMHEVSRGFETLAKFNPMSHCITIASACNVYYRKMCLTPNTIASEPLCGWHGKGKPHSKAALQWLYWKEDCLRQSEPQTSCTEN